MIFVFAFILFFCCLGLYQLCKRCQCARLLGGGSRQRIEHSSDVPPSYNHRLVSNDLSHDDVMISGSIFRIAKRNDDSSNDKNGASSSDQSMTQYERNQMSKPTISYEGGYQMQQSNGNMRGAGSTTQESMLGNGGWRDSVSNLKGGDPMSPASANTMKMKGNTVSHYSIEDVIQNEEEKQQLTPHHHQNEGRTKNLMLKAQTASEKQWQVIPPSSFEMSHLAPPIKASGMDKVRRVSNTSQTNSDKNSHMEYRDGRESESGSKQSTISRKRSETERPLPRQVSAEFDD